MEDFIFGTLITDDLKLIYHRARNRGLQHNYSILPLRPAAGKAVQVGVLVGNDLDVQRMACYYTLDGSIPAGHYGKAENGQAIYLTRRGVNWDTMSWGYVEKWQGEIPAQPDGALVKYRIGAWTEGGPETCADWPDVKYSQEMATHAHFAGEPMPKIQLDNPGRGKTFCYYVNAYLPPRWAREAVIYHIFVDRFYPGDGREWNANVDLRDYCGGTLWGVRDKLDYIQELGATAIWLSPTWPSASYHGYDVTDFNSVAPQLGGNEAMRALIREAHARGIRVLLDLVCNHVSNKHPYFVDAQQNPGSKHRQLFIFNESEIGYRTFFGVRSMPQVNLQNEAARTWMMDIARFWLREFEVDGFRLDHANGPGPGFWSEFQKVCKEENPECFCVGEVVEPSTDYLFYSGRLDGLLDFGSNDSIRRTYGYGSYSEALFERFLRRHLEFFKDSGLLMPTFIDNHDLDRFLFISGGDKDKLRKAAEVQFELPGPPIIYYGTEVGMSQQFGVREVEGLVVSRAPMVWDDSQDRELFSFYQSLIRTRLQNRPWEKRDQNVAQAA